jgi:hypothetical protein
VNPGVAGAAPDHGPAVGDPRPRLPGPPGEPDDIITWYVRPRRRRRRRRLAVAAAVLAAATAGVGLAGWPGSAAAPRPPGRTPKAVKGGDRLIAIATPGAQLLLPVACRRISPLGIVQGAPPA